LGRECFLPTADYADVCADLLNAEKAHNWKSYFSKHLRPYIKGDVLEVGAGIGANTRLFANSAFDRWVCLEPEGRLVERIKAGLSSNGTRHEALIGYLRDLDPARLFDTLLYVDVLEHVEHDREEVRLAAAHLRPGGAFIVLSPAHKWLYSEFDASIGHFRRYTKATLAALTPPSMKLEKLMYLDSAGLLAVLGNRLVLRSKLPTQNQVLFWDNWLVPCSRWLDPLLGHSVGKTVVGVWRKF
jgi:SAM-dependent methyltransferase